MSSQDKDNSPTTENVENSNQEKQPEVVTENDNQSTIAELKKVLNSYFEVDASLREKYATEQEVGSLLELPLTKNLTDDVTLLSEAIKGCINLNLSDDGKKYHVKQVNNVLYLFYVIYQKRRKLNILNN